jgi:arylsulfatase
MDVHSPYEPPAAYRERYPRPKGGSLVKRNGLAPEVSPKDLAVTVSLYDAQINYVDDLVAELLDGLQARGLLEDTVVVFTADHGDEFLEHGGLGHGTTVYGELLRVPLIISFPSKLEAGRRIDHMTQHIDLAPTLLGLLGVNKPESFRGNSVFVPTGTIFAENGPWRAAYADEAKLIVHRVKAFTELYRAEDRLDQTKFRDAALEARLQAHLDRYIAIGEGHSSSGDGASGAEAAVWTDEEMNQLRALGYAE